MKLNLPLEKKCRQCGGKGVEDDLEANCIADCPYCNGSGFVPTSLGIRVLELIRHNSRVKVSAEFQVSSAR